MAMIASGCNNRNNTNAAPSTGPHWTVDVDNMVQYNDLLVTSIRVVSPQGEKLVVSEDGNVKSSILLTKNQQGIYEGTIVICASRLMFRSDAGLDKVFYQLKSGGVRSTSTILMDVTSGQNLSDVVTVHTSNGSHTIGESVPFITVERQLELSVR